MRYLILIVICATLFASDAASFYAGAQTQNSAQEKAASLRAQLSEVETKQAELQTRLQDLDERMKSENIEQALAGVGSTKPEDLREQRRRQLEIERNGVQKQLDLLTTSRTRLETAVAQADAEAYRQSAAPATAVVSAPSTATTASPNVSTRTSDSTGATTVPVRPRRVKKKKSRKSKPKTSAMLLNRPSSQIKTVAGL
jgi:uncharacterized protein YlxW (UPF0749 family)